MNYWLNPMRLNMRKNDLLIENSQLLEAKYTEGTSLTGEKIQRLKIFGTAIQCDRPGINNRSYPLKIMKSQANEFIKTRVRTNRAVAELNHPRLTSDGEGKDYTVFEMNLKKACARIEKLWFEGKNMQTQMVVAEEHSAGKDLKALLDIEYRPGFSLRGAGSVMDTGRGFLEVCDDYSLITIDVVGNPSFDDDAIFDNMYESIKGGNITLLTEAANMAANDFMRAIEKNAGLVTGRKQFNTNKLGNFLVEQVLNQGE